MISELISVIGSFSAFLALVFALWAIGSGMMNGIAQSDMGKLMLAAAICGIIATACLG